MPSFFRVKTSPKTTPAPHPTAPPHTTPPHTATANATSNAAGFAGAGALGLGAAVLPSLFNAGTTLGAAGIASEALDKTLHTLSENPLLLYVIAGVAVLVLLR